MPKLPENPTPEQLHKAYKDGFEGWLFDLQDQARWERFCESQPNVNAQLDIIKDTHKAINRVLLYLSREKYDPGAFSEEAQTTGDCVSCGDRNARDVTRSVEIHIKNEPESYFKRGATEPTYGMRGHSGEGMDPGRAAKFVRDVGWLVRDKYGPVDLTKYNSNIGSGWGRKGTPLQVQELCKKNNVGSLVVPKTVEQSLDAFANGYASHSGQSWGTANDAGSDGINSKSGSWNHDMAGVGYDLSEEFFKAPVVFVPNSWGPWNRPNKVWLANQDVYGPWIPGMIVCPLDEYDKHFVRSGSIYHYSNVKGFPTQRLPNYGAQTVIA